MCRAYQRSLGTCVGGSNHSTTHEGRGQTLLVEWRLRVKPAAHVASPTHGRAAASVMLVTLDARIVRESAGERVSVESTFDGVQLPAALLYHPHLHQIRCGRPSVFTRHLHIVLNPKIRLTLAAS